MTRPISPKKAWIFGQRNNWPSPTISRWVRKKSFRNDSIKHVLVGNSTKFETGRHFLPLWNKWCYSVSNLFKQRFFWFKSRIRQSSHGNQIYDARKERHAFERKQTWENSFTYVPVQKWRFPLIFCFTIPKPFTSFFKPFLASHVNAWAVASVYSEKAQLLKGIVRTHLFQRVYLSLLFPSRVTAANCGTEIQWHVPKDLHKLKPLRYMRYYFFQWHNMQNVRCCSAMR